MELTAHHVDLVTVAARDLHKRMGHHPNIDVEELVGDGLLRAVEIAGRWQPGGQSFDGFLYPRVQWYMLDCMRKRRWAGRYADPDNDVAQQPPMSMDAEIPSHFDFPNDSDLLVDHIEDRKFDLDTWLEVRSLLDDITKISSARTRSFMVRTMLGDTQEEIAADYGIHDSRVCQVIKRTVRRMEQSRATTERRMSTPQVAPTTAETPTVEKRSVLSEAELEVLQLAALGLYNGEIARKLIKGEETVKSQVRSIISKLQARNRVHAVYLAMRDGLIT